MSITNSILSGSLLLGQDVSWNGQNVLTDLCLYTDESTEATQVFDVNFQLEAVINLAAIKLFMLKRDRWRAANVDHNSSLTSFLNELFDEETNLCGTTKKALLVQVTKRLGSNYQISKQKGDTIQYPLKEKSNIIIYGEKLDSTLFIYAHPLIDDFDFLPIYESGTTLYPPCEDRKNDQMVLDEIFGNAFEYEDMLSSAQLPLPANKLSEWDIIKKIAHNMNNQVASRDLIAEAKNAMEEKKQLLKSKNQQPVVITTNRMAKSKPSKYKAPQPTNVNNNIPYEKLTPEKKNIIKNLIKDTLVSPAKENKSINQLLYSSIRYVYRNIMTSSKPIDEAKLQCIIKMHADFYNNIENVVNIFHPEEE